MEFLKGDYVWVVHDEDKYPGQIKGKVDDEYLVEICLNLRKNERNITEIIQCSREEIVPIQFC